jgi:hypothetical protein
VHVGRGRGWASPRGRTARSGTDGSTLTGTTGMSQVGHQDSRSPPPAPARRADATAEGDNRLDEGETGNAAAGTDGFTLIGTTGMSQVGRQDGLSPSTGSG